MGPMLIGMAVLHVRELIATIVMRMSIANPTPDMLKRFDRRNFSTASSGLLLLPAITATQNKTYASDITVAFDKHKSIQLKVQSGQQGPYALGW